MRRPVWLRGMLLYGHRSLPQIAVRVTRTTASVDSTRWASGTVSTRTSPALYIKVARMAMLPFAGDLRLPFVVVLVLVAIRVVSGWMSWLRTDLQQRRPPRAEVS